METKNQVSVSNYLVLQSQYRLTATEQKLIFYMASLIHPDDKDFTTQLVPFKDIERLFNQNNAKWGSIYSYLDSVLDSLTTKTIKFDTNIRLDGVSLKGRIGWVASAIPQYDKEGKLCIEFEFSKHLKPFFLELRKNFTKYHIQDIINLSSPNAIRLYQILKTHKDKQSQHRDIATISYTLDELKLRMGLDDQKAYNSYGNFKNRVLKTAQKQLSEHTHIQFTFKEKKTGRKVTGLVFTISHNLPKEKEKALDLFSIDHENDKDYKELVEYVFKIVKDWGITQDNVKKICKTHDEKYIKEKIIYTKKMEKLGKIKSSSASFFIGALKDDYKDEIIIKKQKNIAKKQEIKLLEISKEEELKKHQEKMESLRAKLLKENPQALEKAFRDAPKKFGYKKELPEQENYNISPMYRAGVHSALRETYPNYFKKEIARHKKAMKNFK